MNRVCKPNPKFPEQKNMMDLGYSFYVLRQGEARSWFKSESEARAYAENE